MKKRSFWTLLVLMVLISVVIGCEGGGGSSAGNGNGNGNPNDPTGPICEGQQSPVAIQVGVPYSGQVCGNNNYSMYTFDTTAAGTYTITVSNISASAALSYAIYTDANYSLPVGSCLQSITNQFACSHSLLASTTYDISTYNTATAGTFTLTVTTSSGTTGAAPDAPLNVLATAGTNQATVSWNTVTGAVGYNLYYSTTAGFDKTSQGVTQVITVASPKIVQNLTAGTNYFFRVTAYNIYGESVLSSQTAATPTPPVNSGTVPLTWNFVDGTLQGWSVTGDWNVMQDVGNGGYLLTDSPTSFYANNSNYSATSPTFDLTSTTAPMMFIRQTYQIGAGDAAYVEISTDNGSTWTVLNGSGYNGNTPAWQTPSFDLTAYKSSSTCKIRLRIQADATTNSGGWFVKYVQLTAN